MSGKFRCQEIFHLTKDVRMDFMIITKNSSADPEIRLYVLVRAFLEEKRSITSGARTHA